MTWKRAALVAIDLSRLEALDDAAFRERVLETMRAHHDRRMATQRSAAKRRRLRHPELFRHYKAIRKARERGAAGSHTHDEWQAKLREHDFACAYCGRRDRPLCRDHVVPIARGGTNVIANIVPACRPCNSKKGAR